MPPDVVKYQKYQVVCYFDRTRVYMLDGSEVFYVRLRSIYGESIVEISRVDLKPRK
jgi:hypothetical protein